jgi:hypothetical protein
MKLSTPSWAIFLISFLMAAAIVGAKYLGLEMPILTALVQVYPAELALGAWFLLFAGVLFNL